FISQPSRCAAPASLLLHYSAALVPRASATKNNSSATVSFGFESLSHRNHREREPQAPKPPRSRASATKDDSSGTVSFGFESLSHQNHREREPQAPKPPRSRASATVSFGFESLSHQERQRSHRE